MLIEARFDSDSDLIECPDDILENIEDLQEKFWKWLFDKNNDHKYWIYKNDQKFGCCYRADAFVEWLNQYVLRNADKEAKVVACCVKNVKKSSKTIFF